MYEPIHAKSVHALAEPEVPHRSREEELDIQLAGHLTALLAVTDELRGLTRDPVFDAAAERIAGQVARLRGGRAPLRAPAPVPARSGAPAGDRTATPADRTATPVGDRAAALHLRAQALAGRALVVAASRADTAAAMLACERMDAHTAALTPAALGAAR
jgi:hypothetical protein